MLPTIAALRSRAEGIVEAVLAENAGRWESASPRDLARVEALTRSVMNRLLHEPTVHLEADSGHARLQLRASCSGSKKARPRTRAEQPLDNVRALRRRGESSLRIATRGSALVLAQAH